MKKVLILTLAGLLVGPLVAQQKSAPQQQPSSPPAQAGGSDQSGFPPMPGQPQAQPAPGQPPRQAKTKEEYAAYKVADAAATSEPDLAKAESAIGDFQNKFPQSELTPVLYEKLMRRYQQSGNAEKTLEMARKTVALDPKSVLALITAATNLAETTRESDLNWNERYAETLKDANAAIQLIDSGAFKAPQLTPDQLNLVKSMAYAAIGSIEFTKTGDTSNPGEAARHDLAAEQALRKATELNTSNPEASIWLRLAITLDHQKKYAEALQAADRAAQLAANDPNVMALATTEQTRLRELTKGDNKAIPH